jgi:uncharacterized DUF497 family protein
VRFEWDPVKARANLRRHGVSFWTAREAFGDKLRTIVVDPTHAWAEERWRLVGYTRDGRLLVVTFTRRRRTIRIISARRATKRERHDHENR